MATKDVQFRVTADTTKAQKGIGDLEKKTQSLMKGFRKLGTIIGVSLGAGVMIKSFLDQEKAVAQLDAVLKSTGYAAGVTSGQMQHLAKSLSEVTKFGDETIIQAENLLLTFTKIGGNIMPAAVESVLNMAEAMGTDLTSQAIQVGKALNDPILGVTALRRVGVQLSKQQEDLVKKLVDTGDIAGAQAIILNELATEFGGVARAAGDTFGGQLARLKNQLGDTGEEIISALLPALKPLLETVSEIIDILTDSFIPVIKKLAELLAPLFEKLSPVLTDIISTIAEIATEIIEALLPALEPLLNAFAEIMQVGKDMFVPILRDLGEMVVKIISDLMPSLAPLLVKLLELNSILIKLALEIIKPLLPLIIELSKLFAGILTDAIQAAIDVIKPLAEFLIDVINGIKDLLGLSDDAANTLQNITTESKNTMEAFVGGLIAQGIKAGYDWIINLNKINTTVKQIKGSITGVKKEAKDASNFLGLLFEKQVKAAETISKFGKGRGLTVPGILTGVPEVRKPTKEEAGVLPTEDELREKFKTFDIIANASAETFRETFSGVLNDLFGDNSILQKLLNKTFGGFLDQMASNLGGSIFSGLLSLLPGGGLLSGLFGAVSGGAGRAMAIAGGGTLMIQNNIAGEEINTVMIDLVPTAMNRAVRLRRA